MMQNLCAFAHVTGKRIQLGVCGSVAAYKSIELMRRLQKAGIQTGVTLTESAQRFVTPTAFTSLSAEHVFTHMFARDEGDFGHLYPGRAADAFMIAPASATTLSRIAHGSADEILSAQALAYNGSIVFAPAMNPRMWANRATQENIRILQERGHVVVMPGTGLVACGEEGEGRLADENELFVAAIRALCPQDLAGKSILITMGPTAEPWDGVRLWTNRSTGTMGACLAMAAYCRGARVYAVCGPGTPALPGGVQRVDVCTAQEMFAAAQSLWADMDAGVFAAAVADFKPEHAGPGKCKKSAVKNGFSLAFTPNPDILAALSAKKKTSQKVIGFAAETENLAENVRAKLQGKQANMIVGNLIGVPDSGFGPGLNSVFVADSRGKEQEWKALPKPEIAWRVFDWLLRL